MTEVPVATPVTLRTGDHTQGTAGARLVLLEYGDFQCPTCKQAAPVVDMLLERHGGEIQFVFRHYPLEQIHPQALLAAQASEGAAAQGKFWEMHRVLFANQQQLHGPDLEHHAAHVGLDVDRFRADLRTHVHEPRVRADIALGQQAKVRSTPGFFINGRIQDVSFGMQALHDAVLAALK